MRICRLPWARAVKIRGEVYGRSAGTMLISTIRCINQAVSDCMVSMAKMLNPPIGILNTALFGDDVVDTSENGLTVLNAAMLAGAADFSNAGCRRSVKNCQLAGALPE